MRKLLDRIPDATLNKVGWRYNLFCVLFLLPYAAGTFLLPFARAWGWTWATGGWITFFQIGWVFLWLPNLMLIGIRADRDFRSLIERRERWAELDRDFLAHHEKRMAWVRGELPPEPDVPPTVN